MRHFSATPWGDDAGVNGDGRRPGSGAGPGVGAGDAILAGPGRSAGHTNCISLTELPLTPRAALAALHASVALFGFAALFGKWIALPATEIVLGRTAIAAATLAIVLRLRRESPGRPAPALAVNGVILALHWVSFFAAVQVSTVAVALLGYASFPLFVLALERRMHRQSTTGRERVAAALATAGLIALVPAYTLSSATTRGVVLGLASGFTFAWLVVRNRALVAARSATHIALWQSAFAALILAPIVLIASPGFVVPSLSETGLLAALGVVCTGAAHTLFIASMRHVSAASASVVAALEPAYGIALATWLLGDLPDPRTMIGGALIIAAALTVSARAR